MKNFLKMMGIIALVAIIGFGMISCDEAAVGDGTATVTSVTVSPATVSVAKGGTSTFTATVSGTDNPAQTVTWSIVQTGKHAGTTISSGGVLTVSASETLSSLTVKATSTVDTSKSGQATVTITSSTPQTPTPNPITGNMGNYDFGYGENSTRKYDQAVWQFTGTNAATLKSATSIVLVLDKAPTAGMQFIWQSMSNWSWNDTDILTNTGTAQNGATWNAGTKTLTISFNTAIKNKTDFDAQTGDIQIVIAYYGTANINDLGIVSANLNNASGPVELTPVVDDVIVTPNSTSVSKGATQQFNAIVTGTGNPAQTVTWSIVEAGKHAQTTISNAGLLTVSADETLSTLTVKATSTADTSKNGTATVTIGSGGSDPGDVDVSNGIQVLAGGADSVAKGATRQFEALNIEDGGKDVSSAVTWSIVQTNKHAGTTISSTGLVTVSFYETLTTLTIKAVLKSNTSKYGTITLPVQDGDYSTGFIHVKDPVNNGTVPMVNPGKTLQFSVDFVNLPENFPKGVTWTFGKMENVGGAANYVSTGLTTTPGGSTISSDGLLTIGKKETFKTLTELSGSANIYVFATSIAASTVNGYGAVNHGLLIQDESLIGGAIAKGGSARIMANVNGTGLDVGDNLVNWTIEGAKAGTTSIGTNGNLTVAAGETNKNLTVRATLKSDSSVYTEVDARVVTVDRVRIKVDNQNQKYSVLARGGTNKFTAEVIGDNNPPQDVYWYIWNPSDTSGSGSYSSDDVYMGKTGLKNNGTTFDPKTGMLTIGANEKARIIRVQAAAQLAPGTSLVYEFVTVVPYNLNAGKGLVIEIDEFEANGEQEITIPNLQYNEVFLAKVNPTATGGLSSGGIISNQLTLASLRPAKREVQNTEIKNTRYVSGSPEITALNSNPPAISASLRAKLNAPKPIVNYTGSAVGAKKNFWISRFDLTNFREAEATLTAIGANCNIWVVDNLMDSYTAQALADKFDTVIYPAVTDVFGYEYGGGPNGDGGRDGDKKIQILIFNINENGGNIGGYFSSIDFYDQATVNTTSGWSSYKTNEAEIFYLAPTNLAFLESTYSTLAHEFQHMINFNQKFVKTGTASETWYNEMCALMAQDIIEPLLSDSYLMDPVMDFIGASISDLSSNKLEQWGTAYNYYGEKYMFGAYLMRNYGGVKLAKAMLANNQVDIASIEAALKEVNGNTISFGEVFSRYGEAFIFNKPNMPATNDYNTLDKEITEKLGSTNYKLFAVNTWAYNEFGDKFYSNTDASLPAYSVSFETVAALRDQEIKGSVTLKIKKPANGVKLYLMVK